MRVLAARFRDRRAASAVRDRLIQTVHADVPDVDIAPLGDPGQPDSNDMVLAGRFADEEASAVAELVREGGGEIVANVDEKWTQPRSTVQPSPWSPGPTFHRARAQV